MEAERVARLHVHRPLRAHGHRRAGQPVPGHQDHGPIQLGRHVVGSQPAPIPARERGTRILREPRLLALLLAGGGMATIVVFVIGFSGALFTASSSSPANAVGAGQIKLSLSNTGELINGAGLTPGVTRSGPVTVTNQEEKAQVSLRVSNLAQTPPSGPSLADLFNVTV